MKFDRPLLYPNGTNQLFSIDTHPSGRFATSGMSNKVRIWKFRRNHYNTISRRDADQIQHIIDRLELADRDVEKANAILGEYGDCSSLFTSTTTTTTTTSSSLTSPTHPESSHRITESRQIRHKISQLRALKESLLRQDAFEEHFDFISEIKIGRQAFGNDSASQGLRAVNCLRFSPNGQLLAIATANKTIEIWTFDHFTNPKLDQELEYEVNSDGENDVDDMSDFNSEKWVLLTTYQNSNSNSILREFAEWVDLSWVSDSMGLFAGDSNGAVNYFSVSTKTNGNLSLDKNQQPFHKSTLSAISRTNIPQLGIHDQFPRSFMVGGIDIYRHADVNMFNDDYVLSQYLQSAADKQLFTTISDLPSNQAHKIGLRNDRAQKMLMVKTSVHLDNLAPICSLPPLSTQQAQLLAQKTTLLYASTVHSLEQFDKTSGATTTTKNHTHDTTTTTSSDPISLLNGDLNGDTNTSDDLVQIMTQIESRVAHPFNHSLYKLPYQDYCLITQTPITDIDGLIIDGAKGIVFDPNVPTTSTTMNDQNDTISTSSSTTTTTTTPIVPITNLYDSLLPCINFDSIVNRYFRNPTNNNASIQRPLINEPTERYVAPDYRKLTLDHPLRDKMLKNPLYSRIAEQGHQRLTQPGRKKIIFSERGTDARNDDDDDDDAVMKMKDTVPKNNTPAARTTTTSAKKPRFSIADDDSEDDNDDFRPMIDGDNDGASNSTNNNNTAKKKNLNGVGPLPFDSLDALGDIHSLFEDGLIDKHEHEALQKVWDQLRCTEEAQRALLRDDAPQRGTEFSANPISIPIAIPMDNLKSVIDPKVMVSCNVAGALGSGSKIQGLAMDPLGEYLVSIYEDRQMYVYRRNPYSTNQIKKVDESELILGAKPDPAPEYQFYPHGKVSTPLVPSVIDGVLLSPPEPGIGYDNNNTTNPQIIFPSSNALPIFRTETAPLFYRRPDWSPDGLLLAVPAGIIPSAAAQQPAQQTHCVHVYSRSDLSTPLASIPTFGNAQAIVVKFNPVPFIGDGYMDVIDEMCRYYFDGGKNDGSFDRERVLGLFGSTGLPDFSTENNSSHSPLSPSSQFSPLPSTTTTTTTTHSSLFTPQSCLGTVHPSITGTAYYYLFAIATTDSIAIHRSDTLNPVFVVENPNSEKCPISDLCWFSNGMKLMSSSQDGLCTFINLEVGEKQNQLVLSSSSSSPLCPIVSRVANTPEIFCTTDGEIMNGFSRFVYDQYLSGLKTSLVEASRHNEKYRPIKPGNLEKHTSLKDGYDTVSYAVGDLVNDLHKALFSLHYFPNETNAIAQNSTDHDKIKKISNHLSCGGSLGLYHPHNAANPINKAFDPISKYLFGSLSLIFQPLALTAAGIAPQPLLGTINDLFALVPNLPAPITATTTTTTTTATRPAAAAQTTKVKKPRKPKAPPSTKTSTLVDNNNADADGDIVEVSAVHKTLVDPSDITTTPATKRDITQLGTAPGQPQPQHDPFALDQADLDMMSAATATKKQKTKDNHH